MKIFTPTPIAIKRRLNTQLVWGVIGLFLSIFLLAKPAFSSDLVGWWRLDDNAATTTVVDSSGYGNTGTLSDANNSPGATTAAHSVSGAPNRGTALSFDGNDDYVSVPNAASLNITGEITIEAWIYPISSHIGGIVEKTIGGTVNTQYLLFIRDAEPLPGAKFRVVKGGLLYDGYTSSYPALNQWTHIVGRYNGSEVSLWINGVKQPTTATVSAPISGGMGDLLIGHLGSSLRPFNGSIEEVRIYNYALSAQEIQHHYQQGGYRRAAQ